MKLKITVNPGRSLTIQIMMKTTRIVTKIPIRTPPAIPIFGKKSLDISLNRSLPLADDIKYPITNM
jgi:hypothetical protein